MARWVALMLAWSLSAAVAQTTIGGVTYDTIDEGPEFVEAARPVQDWPTATATAAEQAAGMLAYQADDPGDYRTYRRPKEAEKLATLRVVLAQGEETAATFAIHALAGLQGLQMKVAAGGAPVTVDLRQMFCWPQRTGWRSRQWYLTPELLLPFANGQMTVPVRDGLLTEVPFDRAAGETQGFWLTFTAAAGAAPGVSRGSVEISAAGRPALEVPLEVEVLPFTLAKPADKAWLLYSDRSRWTHMSDAQVLAELKDFRRHGMDGLISGPFGTPDLSKVREGQVTWDVSDYRKIVAQCAEAGLPGPHVVSLTRPQAVAQALGNKADLSQGDWPAEVAAGVEAMARGAVEATRDIPVPWYFYGIDEPTGENTLAIQDYMAWHAAGARTYATFYVPSFLEKAAAFLTAPCFVVGLVSQEARAKEAREACEKTGAEFWWYGTGSYVNPFPQEGFEFHNRYGAGLLFWKSGAKVEATWTFNRPHEDPFNDFDGSKVNKGEPKDQNTVYPHFLKPNDWSTYQGAIPTIAWEALREGVHDYYYLYTLSTLAERAQASPQAAVRQAGTDAAEFLEGLVNAIPWTNPMAKAGFETGRLRQVRTLTAERIVAQQGLLEGRQQQAAAVPDRQFTLNLKVTEQVGRSLALPSMTIATVDTPPTIDGQLDDAAWRQSARAAGWQDIRDGEPARLGTVARAVADDTALYVAFDCPEPARRELTPQVTEHDGDVWLEDGVELFVAGATRRPYVHVVVTTGNVVLDEAGQDRAAWNPALQTAVAHRTNGWSVELALPWAELARAGVHREAVMSLNFGRNRYYEDAPSHTAWSATYSGFHVPERFGIGLLGDGAVTLGGLRLPGLWGPQTIALQLHNRTDAAQTAEVRVADQALQTFTLPARGKRRIEAAVDLSEAGRHEFPLNWGVAGQPAQTTTLSADIPQPAALPPVSGIVASGAVVNLPVQLNLAPAAVDRYRLRVTVDNGRNIRTQLLPAAAGQGRQFAVRTPGVTWVRVELVDHAGEAIWQSPNTSFIVLD